MKFAVPFIILLAIGVGVYFWLIQTPGPGQELVPRPADEYREITGQANPYELTVRAGDFFYEPEDLILPSETLIKLSLDNIGGSIHDFMIEGTNIRTPIVTSGKTEMIEFYLDPGEYTFYCSVPGHRNSGMEGKIIVE